MARALLTVRKVSRAKYSTSKCRQMLPIRPNLLLRESARLANSACLRQQRVMSMDTTHSTSFHRLAEYAEQSNRVNHRDFSFGYSVSCRERKRSDRRQQARLRGPFSSSLRIEILTDCSLSRTNPFRSLTLRIMMLSNQLLSH